MGTLAFRRDGIKPHPCRNRILDSMGSSTSGPNTSLASKHSQQSGYLLLCNLDINHCSGMCPDLSYWFCSTLNRNLQRCCMVGTQEVEGACCFVHSTRLGLGRRRERQQEETRCRIVIENAWLRARSEIDSIAVRVKNETTPIQSFQMIECANNAGTDDERRKTKDGSRKLKAERLIHFVEFATRRGKINSSKTPHGWTRSNFRRISFGGGNPSVLDTKR